MRARLETEVTGNAVCMKWEILLYNEKLFLFFFVSFSFFGLKYQIHLKRREQGIRFNTLKLQQHLDQSSKPLDGQLRVGTVQPKIFYRS